MRGSFLYSWYLVVWGQVFIADHDHLGTRAPTSYVLMKLNSFEHKLSGIIAPNLVIARIRLYLCK
jgi:hypothetical protein